MFVISLSVQQHIKITREEEREMLFSNPELQRKAQSEPGSFLPVPFRW